MATLVIVGGRDAALEAALRQGHDVFLVSERKPLRKRRERLLGFVHLDEVHSELRLHNEVTFVETCFHGLSGHPRFKEVGAVVAVTERAVLPAAWLRSALGLAGNSPQCAHWCRDKFDMKRRAREAGVRCADFARITRRSSALSLIQRLGLPMIIKPVDSSGARGATTARRQRDVEDALQPGMLAESFVHGLEMSVETFVADGQVLFVNPTEYLLPLWANIVPATLSADTLTAVLELNESVIRALGVRQGMTHLELFLTAEGPVFSEIALRPPGGYLMELLTRAYNFDPWQTLLDVELGKRPLLPVSAVQHAGMWLLHPGEGTVKNVRGLRTSRGVPGVCDVQCRLKPGDAITRREGSGESAAHIIAAGTTRADVVASLNVARRSLTIDVERPRRSSRRRAA